MSHFHQPVLLNEAITALQPHADGIYVDATFGRGGHTRALLNHLSAVGRVIAFDQDPSAVAVGKQLQTIDNRIHIVHSCFAELAQHIHARGYLGQVNGVLLDLGVSSPQLDTPERGFSFMHDGPLDMRMNPTDAEPISSWLTAVGERELIDVLKTYGEERYAKRIARAIIATRATTPITRTRQLAEIVAQAHPAWEPDKHPATRTFQALRIFINQELAQLEQVLNASLEVLAPSGRLVVISFHSLEDRLVKRFMRTAAKGDEYPPDLPVTTDMLKPTLRLIGKAQSPSVEEIEKNPRARSAVLRVAERLS